MRTSSAKAKGRRCAEEVRELLLKHSSLKPQDIIVVPSGVTGPDLLCSHSVNRKYPFVIECKNQEKLNIWSALAQCEKHQLPYPKHQAVVFFKRNRSKLYVALDAAYFVKHFGIP